MSSAHRYRRRVRVVGVPEFDRGRVFAPDQTGFEPQRHMLASGIVRVSSFARIKIGQQLLNLDWVDRAGGWLSRFETVIERDRHQEEVVLGHVELEPTGREQEVVAKRSRADLLNTPPM